MRIVFFLIISVFLFFNVSAQDADTFGEDFDEEHVSSRGKEPVALNPLKDGVVLPEYAGGDEAMMKFLEDNLKYPKEALKSKKQGRVVLRFVVSESGKIGDIKVLRRVSPELDEEAVRVVRLMPDWIPGRQDGKAIPCFFSIPITFKLNAGKKPVVSHDTGTEVDVSFSLSRRQAVNGRFPRPSGLLGENGTLVIGITVNPDGDVIAASVAEGTTIINTIVGTEAVDAARKVKFNKIRGKKNQTGTITYRFFSK